MRTLQRHNRDMARATAEAAEPIIVRVATLLGVDVGAASACLRRGDFRVGERAGETHKQRCAGVAAEVMCQPVGARLHLVVATAHAVCDEAVARPPSSLLGLLHESEHTHTVDRGNYRELKLLN